MGPGTVSFPPTISSSVGGLPRTPHPAPVLCWAHIPEWTATGCFRPILLFAEMMAKPLRPRHFNSYLLIVVDYVTRVAFGHDPKLRVNVRRLPVAAPSPKDDGGDPPLSQAPSLAFVFDKRSHARRAALAGAHARKRLLPTSEPLSRQASNDSGTRAGVRRGAQFRVYNEVTDDERLLEVSLPGGHRRSARVSD
jgi:hypothetical protein